MANEDYELVVGLEVHAELSTKTKIFCSCKSHFGDDPNTDICPVCMALPGALPTLNEKVVEYAVKAGLATNCSISQDSKNDRKNYFYPDLPKSYQISQFDKPLCNHGFIEIEDDNGNPKKIGILRIHIEEDAGKLNHNEFSGGSLVDLNRAGVPLIEIVSEPDISSSGEADRYLKKLKSILQYGTPLGMRHEMKNMNSFKSIQRAIDYEKEAQIEDYENGKDVVQSTMRWDDLQGRTYVMRTKENADDYRYFPEPDLVAIKLSDEYIENIKENLPEMPESRKKRYMEELKLSEKDANALTSSKAYSDIFEKAGAICKNYKAVCNWLTSDIARILNEKEMEPDQIPFSAEDLAELVELTDNGTISTKIGKKVLEELFENPHSPKKIIEEKGWIQISDEGTIKKVVEDVLKNNPKSIEDYKAGKDRALGFLVGQAMKETKGKANPQMLNKMFLEELNK